MAFAAAAGAEDARPQRRVLVDSVHANNYLSAGLTVDGYSYHEAQGFRRAFDYVREQGVEIEEIKHGRLDAGRLANFDLLFLNLASAERPAFLVSEIAAIRAFLEAGGSLLVITDHSNCYFHAHRLEPLFTELDMASFTDTACDVAGNTLGSGNAWLAISRFTDHPVTRNLAWLGMQTGGRVDPRHAVAFTSDAAWADRWRTGPYGEENAPGFYGNFVYTVGEDQGSLGVVLAKTFGRGRIVNIADQNMLGDPFLHYADNFRLWLNAIAWLLDDERLADAKPYLSRRPDRVTFFERRQNALFGSNDSDGYLNSFTLVSRHHWTFAGDRRDDFGKLLVLAHDDVPLTPEDASAIADHLRAGGNVLVLGLYFDSLRETGAATEAILSSMGSSATVTEDATPEYLIASIKDGGAMIGLKEPGAFQNALLAGLTTKPAREQQARGQRLLRAVDDWLPKSN
jgi:hypothetical protein